MKQWVAAPALVALALAVFLSARAAENEKGGGAAMLSHDVYFSLNDHSADARKKLVDACKKYLSKHPGEVVFTVGVLAEDLNRPVNDRDFDVALHILFKDKAAHDQYQEAERHKKFLEENKDAWKKVRVFDSVVEQVAEK
jgi:stress responsive alpha/beta barrel protein